MHLKVVHLMSEYQIEERSIQEYWIQGDSIQMRLSPEKLKAGRLEMEHLIEDHPIQGC